MFEVFEHTADLGLRVRADSQSRLFQDAACGLFSLMVTNLHDVRGLLEREYRIEGEECDYLLFDWLNELLYTFETEKVLLSQFDVSIELDGLRAIARGEVMNLDRHKMEHEVKAITYHGLRVEQDDDGWFAEVIVDI